MSANPNNTPEQKKAWEARKRTVSRFPQPLPRGAVAFWGWNKVGLFSTRQKTPGAFGRRGLRHGLSFKVRTLRELAGKKYTPFTRS